MNPKVDPDLCTGCAVCVDVCPEVFEMRDDELAYVIKENPGDDLKEKVTEAMEACPAEAITI